ncbi:MAG: glycine oxidase ThiO [Mariprofundaceae bacterium]|nr:glycine oxidase ThiO [Mariprofundaceae bacterium]
MDRTKADEFRVMIVGGGIIGCLTAWYLRRLGAVPVIIERGRVGHESSWAGAGILCPIQPWLYPDSFTRLVEASLAMYPVLNDALLEKTGMAIEWLQSGLLVPFFPDDAIRHRQQALDWSRRFGWPVEDLDARFARQCEPALADDVCGALLWPDVGQVRNPRLLQAVRRALDIDGVEIREHAQVIGVDEDDHGRVRGVWLADHSRVQADAVLLAAGSWSGELAQQIGLSIPVEPVKGQIVLLKSEPGRIRHIIKHDAAYFVPRADGRVLVGASMERVGFRRGNTEVVVRALLTAMARIAPTLRDAEIERQWMGFRPGSPDGLPFLGPVPDRPGLWVATGHYRNGVALAPVTAEIISRWILGEAPALDMSDFRVGRVIRESASVGYPAAPA